jgi:hypothetical protein
MAVLASVLEGACVEAETHRRLIVDRSRDLGPQFMNNPHRMVGQDGAFSMPCGAQTFWFFGDTLLGRRTPGQSLWYPDGKPVGPTDMTGKHGIERMLNNTGLLLADRDGHHGLLHYEYICDSHGNLRTLIPLEGDEHPNRHRIWCLHGVCLPERTILFFIKVEMLQDGPFPVNFRIIGSGMAIGDAGRWEFQRVLRDGDCIHWREHDPHFAAAVLQMHGDPWLYLYGAKQDQSGVQGAYLARVTPGQIDQPETYEYLSSGSPEWSRRVSDAVPVFHDMPNELSVSFNAYLGAYIAVHSLGLTGDIVGRTSPAPWGPWSDPTVLWHVRTPQQHSLPYPQLIYAGKEHPSLSREGGKVLYITYVEFEEYFPHLVEITLA